MSSIGTGKRGYKDGSAAEAEFFHPTGVAYVEPDGSLLVSNWSNGMIKKVLFDGNTVILLVIMTN